MRAPASPTSTLTDRIRVRLQPCPGCRRSVRLDHVGADVDGVPHVDYGAVETAARIHARSCGG